MFAVKLSSKVQRQVMVLLPAVAAPLLCGSFSPGLQQRYDSKRAILLLLQQPCKEQGGDGLSQKYC